MCPRNITEHHLHKQSWRDTHHHRAAYHTALSPRQCDQHNSISAIATIGMQATNLFFHCLSG